MPRALIVAPNWIGDALLAQPLLARLKSLEPQTGLDALAPPWVAPVLERMPQIDSVVAAPFEHGKLSWGARRGVARQLAAIRYDAAYVLPNSFKSALVPWFAGIPRRIGFRGEQRYLVLNVRHRLDEAALPLMAERYAQLAEPPGAPVHRPLAAPQLRVDPEKRDRALAALDLDRRKGKVVVMCPGAEFGPSKRWPSRYFASLALHFARLRRQVWLFGSAKDRDITTEIASLAPAACHNLAGRTSLAEAIDLMSLAELVVTNDSGLMHVAAALGRPIVALYGSSSPLHTPPLAADALVARVPIECSPCYARECPYGHFRCMNELTPESVLARLPANLRDDGDARGKTARN